MKQNRWNEINCNKYKLTIDLHAIRWNLNEIKYTQNTGTFQKHFLSVLLQKYMATKLASIHEHIHILHCKHSHTHAVGVLPTHQACTAVSWEEGPLTKGVHTGINMC